MCQAVPGLLKWLDHTTAERHSIFMIGSVAVGACGIPAVTKISEKFCHSLVTVLSVMQGALVSSLLQQQHHNTAVLQRVLGADKAVTADSVLVMQHS